MHLTADKTYNYVQKFEKKTKNNFTYNRRLKRRNTTNKAAKFICFGTKYLVVFTHY